MPRGYRTFGTWMPCSRTTIAFGSAGIESETNAIVLPDASFSFALSRPRKNPSETPETINHAENATNAAVNGMFAVINGGRPVETGVRSRFVAVGAAVARPMRLPRHVEFCGGNRGK
eukprot:2738297-Rhodomonas_salina.1